MKRWVLLPATGPAPVEMDVELADEGFYIPSLDTTVLADVHVFAKEADAEQAAKELADQDERRRALLASPDYVPATVEHADDDQDDG